jgi:hypothetical protein
MIDIYFSSYSDESKLFLYNKLKSSIGLEKYLPELISFKNRKKFKQFCTSDHCLQIETGPYIHCKHTTSYIELFQQIKRWLSDRRGPYINATDCFKKVQTIGKRIEFGLRRKLTFCPRQQRLCNICKVVEDECHFLLNCKLNEQKRKELLETIKLDFTDTRF